MEKVVMTSAERQQKCRAKNPKKAELAQLKQNIKRQNMKDTDPEKANKIKEANRKRKAAQRAKQKASKENVPPSNLSNDTFANNDDEEMNQNDTMNISDDNGDFKTPKRRSRASTGDISSDDSSTTPGQSRQYILGVKIRKSNDKRKNKKIEELIEENNDLRARQDKHDDELAMLDFRIKELEAVDESQKKEIENLKEEKNKNHDLWFGEIFKNLSADAKKEIKNAFTLVAPKLEKGIILRLRNNTGINFSNPLPVNIEEMSELKKK